MAPSASFYSEELKTFSLSPRYMILLNKTEYSIHGIERGMRTIIHVSSQCMYWVFPHTKYSTVLFVLH